VDPEDQARFVGDHVDEEVLVLLLVLMFHLLHDIETMRLIVNYDSGIHIHGPAL
jgi:hypothetical protein